MVFRPLTAVCLLVYVGSCFVMNMLAAVFGTAFTSIPNGISESVGFTTQQMLAFLLFWLANLPFTLLRPNHLAWVFTVKMCTIPPAYIGLFIFCMVTSGGRLGGVLPGVGAGSAGSSSSQTSWFLMSAINAAIANGGGSITNAPDYARWSTTHWAPVWPALVAEPLSATISATLGILATSAINNAWGLQLWNQWDLLAEILRRYGGGRPEVRLAVFVCAAAQALLVLGTNIAANMIPFGLDSAMLLPRYISAVRGQVLGLVLAWALNPWQIMHSAGTFTTFLSGYGLFMAAIVGPTTVEYFVHTRGNLWVDELYHYGPVPVPVPVPGSGSELEPELEEQPQGGGNPNRYYGFNRGVNISAFVAYFAGIAIPFAGFLGTLGVDVSATARNLGHLGWLLSYFVSAVVYYACCRIRPTPAQAAVRARGMRWEELAKRDDDDDHAVEGDAIAGASSPASGCSRVETSSGGK